ncbi:mechanosensitive ion channel family protein [Gayadomonas joobiniege]|uniref:mechanosensitive ion channel family protein n=1 Tax=Gayadomonas joobiniege TaxID=1234606 RepID=UPI00036F50F9|nr:mechanosensitive ion channel domain-containing protein [Gayadomonas joobiniege]
MLDQDIAQIQKYYDMVVEYLITYSFQLLAALVIFLIFLWLASRFGLFIKGLLTRRRVDITLSQFLGNIAKLVILAVGIIIALGKVGISITPFVAAIGAASLGVGLALQGMLSNYSAGLVIILTRPFTVGNTITVQDITGVVQEVRLANTILINEEEEVITVPNKYLIGDIMFNSYENKLAELEVGIAYSADANKTIELIKHILEKDKEVDSDRPAQVGIAGFADSSVLIGVRYWAPTRSYYQIQYRINGLIYAALQQNDIQIPFPQREVKILSKDEI